VSNNIINASFIDRQNIYQMDFIFNQIKAKERNAFRAILIAVFAEQASVVILT